MRSLFSAVTLSAILSFIFPLSGCLEDDVGVVCSFENRDENSTQTQVNKQALDCSSRICISYNGGANTPRCATTCDSDDDCPQEAIAGCKSKFVCRIATELETSGIQCCKFCVCNDYADTKDPLVDACSKSGVSKQCPNL